MRNLCLIIGAAACAFGFSGCSTTGISATAYNPGYGPFDRNGDYVEAWADKPAKKHWWSRQSAPQPGPSTPATREKEPQLLADNSSRSSEPTRSTTRRPQASSTQLVSRPARVVRPATEPTSRPPVVVANTAPKPAASAKTTASPPPKPKPKPKPAPKPSVRHSVVKGDTLYSLSRRYGTSVSAIQKANGLSGTTIRLGQSLNIPK